MSSRPAALPGQDLTDPRDVLRWATDAFGERVAISTSLGPQTLVLIDMLHQMDRRVPVFFLDTGLLFAETYRLRMRVQAKYDLDIQAIRPAQTVAEQARTHGDALWARNHDLCCQLRKVDPLDGVLDHLDAWITGLRRDQSASRADTQTVEWDDQRGLIKINPLAHWTRAQVFSWLRANDVPYNPLLDDGYLSVGCRPCTSRSTGDDERSGRWAGTEKTECGIHHLFPAGWQNQES